MLLVVIVIQPISLNFYFITASCEMSEANAFQLSFFISHIHKTFLRGRNNHGFRDSTLEDNKYLFFISHIHKIFLEVETTRNKGIVLQRIIIPHFFHFSYTQNFS